MDIFAANDNVIYTVTASNPAVLFRSTSGGDSWMKMNTVPEYSYSLAVDPTDEQIIYVGCNNSVYRSVDGGLSWSINMVPGYYIYGIMVNPDVPSAVYAAGRVLSGSYYTMAFFRSTDSGATWDSTVLSNYEGWSYCIEIDPNNTNTIYVGGFEHRDYLYFPKVYHSTDGGVTFSDISNDLPASDYNYVTAISVHATTPSLIFAGTYAGGIFRSTNGGNNWDQCGQYDYIYSIASTSLDPLLVFAGGDTCVYVSTDQGTTWTGSNAGLYGKDCRALYASGTTAGRIYTANNVGFSRSSNGGSTWSASNTGMNIASIASFAVAPSQPSTMFSAVLGVSMYRTTDNGNSWTIKSMPVSCGSICALVFDRVNPATVFCFEGAG